MSDWGFLLGLAVVSVVSHIMGRLAGEDKADTRISALKEMAGLVRGGLVATEDAGYSPPPVVESMLEDSMLKGYNKESLRRITTYTLLALGLRMIANDARDHVECEDALRDG